MIRKFNKQTQCSLRGTFFSAIENFANDPSLVTVAPQPSDSPLKDDKPETTSNRRRNAESDRDNYILLPKTIFYDGKEVRIEPRIQKVNNSLYTLTMDMIIQDKSNQLKPRGTEELTTTSTTVMPTTSQSLPSSTESSIPETRLPAPSSNKTGFLSDGNLRKEEQNSTIPITGKKRSNPTESKERSPAPQNLYRAPVRHYPLAARNHPYYALPYYPAYPRPALQPSAYHYGRQLTPYFTGKKKNQIFAITALKWHRSGSFEVLPRVVSSDKPS